MKYFEFNNVSFKYEKENILDEYTFDLDKCEILLIKGKSGIGKSTILKLISGFEDMQQGYILLDGLDISNEKIEKRNVGYLFQEFALFPHMNAYQNISYGISKLSKREVKERVSELLEIVDMRGYEKRYPVELSGGQKQRIALARSLANRPKLLLLDEPFSSLDEELRDKLRVDIKKILKSQKITAIIVSHDSNDEIIADRVVELKKN
ncbi:ABC transporter ATP-binding protein [Caviibacter abscessus]|uniref:ABC transporter ATP-binding protein n=1 Tax=Caviibacter abscessus TaxID=1766719 RepID=UPI0008388B1C|nr:ABC transporter ATP-binding protein [Caviibacter abscessus]